jgi:hypothetical protein
VTFYELQRDIERIAKEEYAEDNSLGDSVEMVSLIQNSKI